MKSASILYLPFSLWGNYVGKDLSNIKFEQASKKIIIARYMLTIIFALLFVDYPYVCYPFLFENGAMQHFRLESVLAGNLDVVHTILRCVIIYGYALFLALSLYSKKYWIKGLNLALFAVFVVFSVKHHAAIDVFLAFRAAFAWFLLLHFFKDFLNKNYKNLLYNSNYKIVCLKKENDNVSVWRAMFFSAIIIALQLFIVISIFYSAGGAI